MQQNNNNFIYKIKTTTTYISKMIKQNNQKIKDYKKLLIIFK